MNRITKKLDNGFYECVNEIMTWEGGIRQTQIIGQYEDIEEELGIDLITLFKALKSKQCGLRYFDKTDAIINKCEVGWYVQMLMYGFIPLKDFIKALTREELKNEK